MVSYPVDPDAKGLHRVGGTSAVVLFLSYIAITVLFVLAGPRPSGAQDWLLYVGRNRAAWWAILALSVLTDFLFLPIALSLYHALRHVNRNLVLAGAGLIASFVVLDLAVTWPNYAGLIALSRGFAADTDSAVRAASLGAAQYATSVLASPLFSTYAILLPSVGILLVGVVMLHGEFGKVAAYVGIGTGIVGTIAVVGGFFTDALAVLSIIASVLTTVWALLVGIRLLQSSRG